MKTINIAVIGAGWFGDVHSECFLRAQSMLPDVKVNLHTIVDICKPNAIKCMEKYGFRHYTDDWHEVVENPDINLIDVCTDNKFHREMSIAAIEHGKHVFCEKPLADRIDDAELMAETAKKADVINMVDFHYRKIPALAQLHDIIQEGQLGRIYHVKGMFLQDFGFGSPMTWRFKKSESGGGSIVTMGAHVIDAVRYLVGEVDEVCSIGETFIDTRVYPDTGKTDTCDVDDAMTVLLKFKNGAIGMLMTSWLCHGCKHHHELEIYGEKGSAKFNSERLNELELWL
ncbi:MAG: Gfo/Idh/MocA family oxidoreductase, partial [Oscillospiraceae bacterium]